ncbi:MAG: general secretion pathway protein D [Cellvibrionaceae bacterium]|jgi:general secretion pathway protein D
MLISHVKTLLVKKMLMLKMKILFLTLLMLSAGLMAQPPNNEGQKWQVNFKDSDIQEVIKFVADVTGKTVVIDPRVKGRVKVISAEPLTERALYDLFLSVLEIQGFTAIEVGNVVRILPRKDARTSAVPVTNSTNLGSDAYITQVIQLYNVSAAKVLPVLRPLAPQHAHLAAYAPSNAIIISDTVANIARLRDIINRIDRAGVADTDIVPLKYAQAESMVKTLQTLQKTDEKDAPKNSIAVLVADARSNSILVTGDDVRRKRIKALIERLDVPRQQSGNVRVVYLEYADAEKVAEVLSKVVSSISKLDPEKGAAPGGGAAATTVEADPSTNALLITADAATLETLLPVIDRLDIRRAQVLVEAIIVEVTGNLGRQLGVEWAAFKEERVIASSGNSGSLAGAAGAAATLDPSAISGLLSTPALLLGFGGSGGDGGTSFAGLIKVLQSNTEANILSTPSILTTDNNEATISIGDNIPFVTGSFSNDSGGGNPFQTIERRDVGIKLSVIPQISEGDTVVLEIDQEISGVSSQPVAGAVDIVTNERKITTQVIAKDGEVIILGGLLADEVQQTQQKVPLLGDIPLLGALFRNDETRSSKTNLMIFLKATIVRDEEELRGATAEKYNYIRNEQIKSRENGVPLMRDDVIPLLPIWDAYVEQSVPSAQNELNNSVDSPDTVN